MPTAPLQRPGTELERARLADAILADLLDLAADEREAELRRRCGDDSALYEWVERLLRLAETEDHRFEPGAPLAAGFADPLLDDDPSLGAGAQVGRFRIVRELGRGGMSVVYLAQQNLDGAAHFVALKRMRAALDGSGMAERFARERRILARLSHPAIAGIIDIGSDAQQRPWIAMEYVDGLPIDRYCDSHRLGIEARLRLFLHVAAAVAFAHARLVVHRDIKPGNILVDREGHARLLDFGIAKLLDDEDTQLTATARAPQTPAYASPEQVRGEAVGTASDVYQLGLLLYLLLAGALPYAHERLDPRALARAILDGRLPPASRRLDTVDPERRAAILAARGLGSGEALRHALAGDLDTVLAKALATEPQERYPSVEHLADDVRNLLDGRPVSARRPSWTYTFGKLVRRHPAASTLAAALVVLLVGFSIAISMIALDLEQARRHAVQEGELSDRVLEHVLTSLRELEPSLSGFDGSVARHTLDRAAEAAPNQFGDGPLTRAHLHLTLGRGYELLWAIDEAAAQYELAAAQLGALRGDERRRMEARVANGRGRVARVSGQGRTAESEFRRVLELGAGDPDLAALTASATANLGTLLTERDQVEEGLALYRQASRAFERIYGPAHPSTLNLRLNIALTLLRDEGLISGEREAEALALLEQLTAQADAALGPESSLGLTAGLLQARAHCYAGRPAQCARLLQDRLPVASRVLGEQSLQVLKARAEFGLARVRNGEHAAGLEELEEAASLFVARWDAHGRHSARHSFGLNRATAQALLGQDEAAIDALLAHAVAPELVARVPELAHLLEHPRLLAGRPTPAP